MSKNFSIPGVVILPYSNFYQKNTSFDNRCSCGYELEDGICPKGHNCPNLVEVYTGKKIMVFELPQEN